MTPDAVRARRAVARGRRCTAGAALLAALAAAACERSSGPERPALVESRARVDASNELLAGPWRYKKALEEAVTPGLAAAPVLELANGRTGQAHFLLAVDRGAGVAVECWRFDQNNDRGLLARAGEPIPALRLRPDDPPAPIVAELRRERATPGVEITRPKGIASADPEEFLRALARASAGARDPAAAPRDRALALARLIRGLDDTLVLDRDVVFRVLEPLAAGAPWAIAESEAVGARRLRVRTAGPSPLLLELTRTRDGFVLTDLRDAPADAAEGPAPSPAPAPG